MIHTSGLAFQLVPQEQAILSAITKAAQANKPCPTNDALCQIIGASSSATPARCIARLERKGTITVERGNDRRVITINATGERTAGKVDSPHWRHRQPPPLGPLSRTYRKRSTGDFSERAPMEFLPVDRTPCFYCGIRGDVGCAHRHAA